MLPTRILVFFCLATQIAAGCGQAATPARVDSAVTFAPPAFVAAPRGGPGPDDADAALRFWREIAPTCEGFPSKADCVDGDMTLFAGLLCAAGERSACEMVRLSQDEDGRFWRSPRRVGDNLGERHSFSRDMSLGAMLYLVTTHDARAARRWVEWIQDNRACAVESPFGGCMVWGPHRFCRDDDAGSCTVTPASWAMLGRVFDYLGIGRTPEMLAAGAIDTTTMLVEAANAPVGFELHLVAVEVFLKMLTGATPGDRARAAASIVARQPDNPFFVYLAGQDQAWWPRAQEICPKAGDAPSTNLSQWAWERATDDRAWEESMAWDCVFLARLSAPTGGLVRRD